MFFFRHVAPDADDFAADLASAFEADLRQTDYEGLEEKRIVSRGLDQETDAMLQLYADIIAESRKGHSAETRSSITGLLKMRKQVLQHTELLATDSDHEGSLRKPLLSASTSDAQHIVTGGGRTAVMIPPRGIHGIALTI